MRITRGDAAMEIAMIKKLQGLKIVKLFKKESVATSATANSDSIDTLENGDETMFILDPTTISGGASTVKVQDSPDDSTWTDLVSFEDVPGDTDDGKLYGAIVSRTKTAHARHLRVEYVHGGSGSAVLELTAILGDLQEYPKTDAEGGFDGGLTLS